MINATGRLVLSLPCTCTGISLVTAIVRSSLAARTSVQ